MMEKHKSCVHPTSIHPFFFSGSHVEQVENGLKNKRVSITIAITSSDDSRPCRAGSGISQGHPRNKLAGKRRATT